MRKEEIEKLSLEAYPKIGEWNGDEKDWIDANYHLRIAFKKGLEFSQESNKELLSKIEELEKEVSGLYSKHEKNSDELFKTLKELSESQQINERLVEFIKLESEKLKRHSIQGDYYKGIDYILDSLQYLLQSTTQEKGEDNG